MRFFITLFIGSILLYSCGEDEELGLEQIETSCIAEITYEPVFALDFEDSYSTFEGEGPVLASSGLKMTDGIKGLGVCFGPTDTLQYKAFNNISYTQGSLSLWVRPYWWPGENKLYRILYYGTNPKHFELHIDENKLVAMGMNTDDINNQGIRVSFGDASTWEPGQWQHIIYTWSCESLEIYLNGILEDRVNVGFDIPSVSADVFHIGSTLGKEGFNGTIDEVYIFDRVLSQEEVLYYFNEFNAPENSNEISSCEDKLIELRAG